MAAKTAKDERYRQLRSQSQLLLIEAIRRDDVITIDFTDREPGGQPKSHRVTIGPDWDAKEIETMPKGRQATIWAIAEEFRK